MYVYPGGYLEIFARSSYMAGKFHGLGDGHVSTFKKSMIFMEVCSWENHQFLYFYGPCWSILDHVDPCWLCEITVEGNHQTMGGFSIGWYHGHPIYRRWSGQEWLTTCFWLSEENPQNMASGCGVLEKANDLWELNDVRKVQSGHWSFCHFFTQVTTEQYLRCSKKRWWSPLSLYEERSSLPPRMGTKKDKFLLVYNCTITLEEMAHNISQL